jgi:asparagine synthase (glutamine-hydrolysing)
MTALAGLWRFDGRPDTASDCSRMLASQALYGPDTSAQWSDRDVALGRSLMRLLPEDAFDRQPLIGGGGRYILVADLRLDNRDELVGQLQISSEKASRLSDAAILLESVERWGVGCVEKLVGDYAFALWDGERRNLLLARDPLGQRPLHYHRGNGFFAFASMPKGLHALAAVPYEPDEDGVAEYLLLMSTSGTRTYFRGIERVLPGHIVTITPTGLAAQRHWQPKIRPLRLRHTEDYCEALRNQLDAAVKCRLRGAKDVGSHLSGGLDSPAVTATAARLLAPSGGRVIAFTRAPREGYDGPVPRHRFANEVPHAAATAALYPNIEHVVVRTDGKSPLDQLDRNFSLFDQPVINDCNAVAGSRILDLARSRKLTVILNGGMGNLGMSHDGGALLAELFRSGRWLRLWREARILVGAPGMRWRGVMAKTFGPWCPPPLWVWLNKVAADAKIDPMAYSVISPGLIAELDLFGRARKEGVDFSHRPPKNSVKVRLSTLQSNDSGNANKGVLGGWHVDQRDPTADVRLLEFCLSVPTEQFWNAGVQRALARRALADRLPKIILEETRRGQQSADWHETLTAHRDRIAAEIRRLDFCPPACRALDLPRLHRSIDDWPKDGWERPEVFHTYYIALSRAVSAGHFLRRTTGSNA